MKFNLLSILLLVIGVGAGVLVSYVISYLKNNDASKKAEKILDDAKKEADKLKNDLLVQNKDEIEKIKNSALNEVKEKKDELKRNEDRLLQREASLDKRDELYQQRETNLSKKEEKLNDLSSEIQAEKSKMDDLKKEEEEKLEKISKLSKEDARKILMDDVKKDMDKDVAEYIKEREDEAKESADKTAKELIVTSMQRYAADVSSEQTVTVVSLPNDDIKGRIIGREGRNIRTLEAVCGVDLIIDDTPEAVVVSSFDPLRRDIARTTLETLVKDGRIHPTKIEEVYDKTCRDFHDKIIEYGNDALFELGISKMDPALVELVGKLHFRTSYGQNCLDHSIEVGQLAGVMAGELGEDVTLAKRAGLLHDIGKAIDHDIEGSHVELGVNIAKKYHENDIVINAIASHHGDTPATSIIANLVAVADALSASRPGARNDTLENYIQRLTGLEEVANKIDGVSKSYALQAGRELRILVDPEKIDDAGSHKIARDVKKEIEATLKYPGTIKVTVVRETRAVEEAK